MSITRVTLKPQCVIIVPCLYLLFLDPAQVLHLLFVFFNLSPLSSLIIKNIQELRNSVWSPSVLVLEAIISIDRTDSLNWSAEYFILQDFFYSSGFLRMRKRTFSEY